MVRRQESGYRYVIMQSIERRVHVGDAHPGVPQISTNVKFKILNATIIASCTLSFVLPCALHYIKGEIKYDKIQLYGNRKKVAKILG